MASKPPSTQSHTLKQMQLNDFFEQFKDGFVLSGWSEEIDRNFRSIETDITEQFNNGYRTPLNIRLALQIENNVYFFCEDPNDGYRSYLDGVIVAENASLSNRFFGVECLLVDVDKMTYSQKTSYIDNNPYQSIYNNDTLEVVDGYEQLFFVRSVAGDYILAEIGTEYTDNYYPSAIVHLHPERLTESISLAEKQTLMQLVDAIEPVSTRKKRKSKL